ncbi:MAG: hypothetical protein K2K35_06850 [Lachnospiraceae bacterium]|nr:hypothetical protein [Lachnospiraceae bacterium]
MFFTAQVDIDEDGIIAQMERVETAQRNLEEEMEKLHKILWKAKIKEKGSSEELPNNLPDAPAGTKGQLKFDGTWQLDGKNSFK